MFTLQSMSVPRKLCLPFIPPDGEVAALKSEVDHLDDSDRRRAHPETDTTAEIWDDLRLL